MKTALRNLTFAALIVVIGAPMLSSHAQETDGLAAELDRYKVEIIVLRHLAVTGGPEDPGPPPLPPEPAATPDALMIDPPTGAPDVTASLPTEPEPPFFSLADDFLLDELAGRIRRSADFRVLLHEAWVQPGYSRESTQPVELAQLEQFRRLSAAPSHGAEPEMALQGSATLYRGRYLHLVVDLTHTTEDGLVSLLTESRRMRSGEVHYLDAPGIGVIALISSAQAGSDAEPGDSPSSQSL